MNITIIGTGVYGLSIANVLKENKNNVLTMWTEKKDTSSIDAPVGTKITNSYEEACKGAKIIFVLTGCKFVPSVLEGMKDYVEKYAIVILGSKGILDDGSLPLEIAKNTLKDSIVAVIGGPTFAKDISILDPVGFTLGVNDFDAYLQVKSAMSKVYLEYSSDTLAVEMSGSLKNAYAIGSGLIHGLNFGPSTTCLYITRVLEEISNIFESLKCNPASVKTLACIGDLTLTCTSENSRNFTFGTILAKNDPTLSEEYLKNTTVEGYENLEVYYTLFKNKNIACPILSCVKEIVSNNSDPKELIELLLK